MAVHGVVASGEPMYVQETGPYIAVDDADPRVEGAIWVCTVNEWKAATVVESRSYAPGISLLLRAGAFGALEIAVDEVVSVDVQPSESRPRPTRQVPMFANWFEPCVTVTADLAKQIEAMCLTAPDEEST